jgi:hypothetical protein
MERQSLFKSHGQRPWFTLEIKHAAKVLSEDAALLRRVQIYLCHKFSGQKLKDIGLHF